MESIGHLALVWSREEKGHTQLHRQAKGHEEAFLNICNVTLLGLNHNSPFSMSCLFVIRVNYEFMESSLCDVQRLSRKERGHHFATPSLPFILACLFAWSTARPKQ